MSLYRTNNMNFTLPFELSGTSGEYEARPCAFLFVPKKSKIKKIVFTDASWYTDTDIPSSYYFKFILRETQKHTAVYTQQSNDIVTITRHPLKITEETPVEFDLSNYSLSDDYPYIGVAVESKDRTCSYGISIRGYLQF
jgi:hypothetical protein